MSSHVLDYVSFKRMLPKRNYQIDLVSLELKKLNLPNSWGKTVVADNSKGAEKE